MPQDPTPSVDRVREVFERILAQPEFAPRVESPLSRALAAVRDTWRELVERFFPTVGATQLRVITWSLAAVALASAAYLLRGWMTGRLATGRGRRRRHAPVARPRDAAGWVRWARSQAGEGRLREAATGLYQGVVLHLEAEGALRYGAWKTPGDYAAETRSDEALHRRFRGFLAHFVTVAFGPAEPSAEALDTLFRHAEGLGCPG